jgi:hypothetical protein
MKDIARCGTSIFALLIEHHSADKIKENEIGEEGVW